MLGASPGAAVIVHSQAVHYLMNSTGHYCYIQQLQGLDACRSHKRQALPPRLGAVATPMIPSKWAEELSSHPDQDFAKYILTGIREGFRIGFNPSRSMLKPRPLNMPSADEHPEVVLAYVQEELVHGRLAAITAVEATSLGIHTSPFGVIPKRNRPNKWRLILDLSSPYGHSVNDGIEKELSSLSYVSVDEVVEQVLKLGKGTLMAKMDIKHAYRNVPVHPEDRYLLGMKWDGAVYIDTTLPFGLRSAPLIFSALADALTWVMRKNGVSWVEHYIDDFITVGAPGGPSCIKNSEEMHEICRQVGLPVEPDKDEGPATSITFLGLELDSIAQEIRLPEDKLTSLRALLKSWRGRKACRKRELLSLIGSLSHASRAIKPGRSYLRRLIELSASTRRLDQFIRLNKQARADIEWWACFAGSWNGTAMMLTSPSTGHQVVLTSDASGNWGCGAFSGSQWFMLPWLGNITKEHITVKELAPIVVAAAIWGSKWRGKVVLAQCDNTAAVACINSGASRNVYAMQLRRCLSYLAATGQFAIWATHIHGVNNQAADALSRNNLPFFRLCCPQAQLQGSPIPAEILDTLLLKDPDWTARSWMEQWTSTVKRQ